MMKAQKFMRQLQQENHPTHSSTNLKNVSEKEITLSFRITEIIHPMKRLRTLDKSVHPAKHEAVTRVSELYCLSSKRGKEFFHTHGMPTYLFEYLQGAFHIIVISV
jgi:hypothetical protein